VLREQSSFYAREVKRLRLLLHAPCFLLLVSLLVT